MRLPLLSTILLLAATATSMPAASTDISQREADPSLAGYLGVFFLGNEPSVYFYLSNGNNAFSFKALNGGRSILDPKLGTGGVRDPSLIEGGGAEKGKKWYIIGTDLDIAKTTWNLAQRNGSLSIFVWESTDLINWSAERIVKVDNKNAGMVWAPDAVWDPQKGEYLVHWAARLYPSSDPYKTGPGTPNVMRYSYTKDFRTFSAPQTLINKAPTPIIDLSLLQLAPGSNSWVRFLKNESVATVYMERSDTGLFGTWYRPGGAGAIVRGATGGGVEGPYAYHDNVTPGKVNLLLDYYGSDGYRPFSAKLDTAASQNAVNWVDENRSAFPANLRHGSVLGITKQKWDALNAKWG